MLLEISTVSNIYTIEHLVRNQNNKIANCKPFPKHVDTDRNQNNNTADYRSISKACRHREKSEQ